MSEIASEMEEDKLPSGINVLTILTFIGSGCFALLSLWNYYKSSDNLARVEEMISKPEFQKAPDFVKKMYSPEMLELMRKLDANKLPLMIISIISYALCIYGAIEMRKLKNSGFYIYTIGEFLPVIGTFLFIGMQYLGGGWTVYSSIGFPFLFVLLYAFQVKYLVNK